MENPCYPTEVQDLRVNYSSTVILSPVKLFLSMVTWVKIGFGESFVKRKSKLNGQKNFTQLLLSCFDLFYS